MERKAKGGKRGEQSRREGRERMGWGGKGGAEGEGKGCIMAVRGDGRPCVGYALCSQFTNYSNLPSSSSITSTSSAMSHY